ncbi:MAG TPA: TIM barrel protein [Pirellulales bacterium]|nr:TIM barrel protein [Pirellulales bacterium]
MLNRHLACVLLLLSAIAAPRAAFPAGEASTPQSLFARENLVAWCIVPFDRRQRTPEDRAEMLARLGFRHFAYDWRAEHLPTFERELQALAKHGIALDAVWFPAALNDDAKTILASLERHKIHTQLWITMGDPAPGGDQAAKVAAAADLLKPIAEETERIGCQIALYNHGGWFGEPENQLAVIDRLGLENVGIVYNLHHGHDHLDRLETLLRLMMPHLLALNLNGMTRQGDRFGRKILPLAQGEVDLPLLRTICASGYRGPIGILGHTMDDAEERLRDNLDGLDWLVANLAGRSTAPRPTPRTPVGEAPSLPAGQFRGRLAEGKPDYRQPPLTVECRAKLLSSDSYNILVAGDTKQSGAHWELFSMAGNGLLTAYLPGMKPDHVRSQRKICDGAWHDAAMLYEADRVRLVLDGEVVADQPVESAGKPVVPGGLGIGRLAEGGLGCHGELAHVRLTRGIRAGMHRGADAPAADGDTIGLWIIGPAQGDLQDKSPLKNTAKVTEILPTTQGPVPAAQVNFELVGAQGAVELIDRSRTDAYLGVKVDGEGRLFVGAREVVYRFAPDRGGFKLRQEVCRLPADSIVMGLEFRGDDLYVLANNALYLLSNGRIQAGVRPRRILWGLPLDLHVSFHCLAWGPEGDLYLTHGDPLLNYGDWNRPDHWGHWTLYAGPKAEPVPYTGVGAVLRVRPDGSRVRVVAGGLRGPVGLAFDPQWNLFTNDNDHESRADLYAPARLLHVTPHIDFAWPRGWIASKSPRRSDLIEPVTNELGRGVPCDLLWRSDAQGADSLLMARWDQMSVSRFAVQPRGASFSAQGEPFLAGRDFARPVGMAMGPDGRMYVTSLYLGGNVGSPHCYSDLVMISGNESAPAAPRLATASSAELWEELSHPDLLRRQRAHQEILRRGGLREAARKLRKASTDDPAQAHLPWLLAAGGLAEARRLQSTAADDPRAARRVQAIRVLAEFKAIGAPDDLFITALDDRAPAVQLAALAALFDRTKPLPTEKIARLAAGDDTYLRQTAASLLAQRAPIDDLARLTKSDNAAIRRAAVLALGFRLTVPPHDFVPPEQLPLSYHAGNASFKLAFADADQPVDLRALGRVGSFTTADWWKLAPRTADRQEAFHLLVAALDDTISEVVEQAAYFLSLLNDAQAEPLIAEARRRVLARQAANFPPRNLRRAWVLPVTDAEFTLEEVSPPERGPVDLAATYAIGSEGTGWREADLGESWLTNSSAGRQPVRWYLYFQLQSTSRRAAAIELSGCESPRLWHNGRAVVPTGASFALELQSGGNDFLVRVDLQKSKIQNPKSKIAPFFRAASSVVAGVPERLDAGLLAERLKQAAAGADQVSAELLTTDWSKGAEHGDANRGRALFGSLGCVKCHGITLEQAGGGAPNLAGIRRRFNTAYVVESILLPSKQVADPFRAATLQLADGRTLTGLILADAETHLELLLPDASRMTIAISEIDERSPSSVSPMPSGLVKTEPELRDLLAYLFSDSPTPP